MARRPIAGSRALITGASGGIGRALAIELARQGSRLTLLARRADALSAVAADIQMLGGEVECIVGDVTDPATRATALDRATTRFGGLDILINNAGVGAFGRFDEAASARLRQLFEVNFFAAAELTREALPLLKKSERPIVVNVSSILGHRAVPRSSEYCASKFALQGLSESLRAEFSTLGIDLLVVSPGTTETEFFEHVVERDVAKGRGGTRWPKQRGVSAESVAKATVRAIRLGRHEIIPNFRGRLLVRLNRLVPGLVDRLMSRYG